MPASRRLISSFTPERIGGLGCRFFPLLMDNKGTHLGRDLLLMWRFFLILRRERPSIYLGCTIKPNIYGSLAAHLLGIPIVNNVAGLGSVFVRGGWLAWFVRQLYRLALARSIRVFFQNEDDRQMFVSAGLVRPEQAARLPGSGVDLKRFNTLDLPVGESVRFLLVVRMLWEKGVGEFVDAARILKARFPQAEFCLLGFLDMKNPDAMSRDQMSKWVAEGVIHYLGETDDVPSVMATAHCVVLPSFYREGVPRALLEAAAMGSHSYRTVLLKRST